MQAAAPAGDPRAALLASTASVIEFGSFFGFSTSPSTGMTIRKWAK